MQIKQFCNKARRIMGNQRGNTFLENGVWIILIVFVLAVAGAALALAVSGKYTELTNVIKNITVPSLQA